MKTLSSRPREVFTSLVDGCAVGMVGKDGNPIRKRWRVDCDYDYKPLASSLDTIRCTEDHVHSESFDLRETQHYPLDMCRKVLRSLK